MIKLFIISICIKYYELKLKYLKRKATKNLIKSIIKDLERNGL
jgi:hypothetical protein